jgi:hypothetical protein
VPPVLHNKMPCPSLVPCPFHFLAGALKCINLSLQIHFLWFHISKNDSRKTGHLCSKINIKA